MPQIFKPGCLLSDLAKADLPLPTDMMEQDNMEQWNIYIQSIPLSRAFNKFAQCTDRFHATMDAHKDTADLTTLPAATQAQIYSHWAATHAAGSALYGKLRYKITHEEEYALNIHSGTALGLYFTAEFMRDINAPDAALWGARLKREQDHDAAAKQKNFERLISIMSAKAYRNTPQP